MTKEQIAFIEKLDINEIMILKSLLKEDKNDLDNYLNKYLMNDNLSLNVSDLLKDIPVSYIPIFGISYPFVLKTVDDCINTPDIVKSSLNNLGPIKVSNLDYAVSFLISHVNKQIRIHKESNIPIISGKNLLDKYLLEKEVIIENNIENICDYLISNGNEYVFSGTKNRPDLSRVSPKIKGKLVTILARYSELSDLEDFNIDSFSKFIKK